MAFIPLGPSNIASALMQQQQPISTGPTRSQLVNQFLQQQAAQQPQRVSSYVQGFANLGSDLVGALMAKDAIDEQMKQQDALARQDAARRQAFAQALGVQGDFSPEQTMGIAQFRRQQDQLESQRKAEEAAAAAKTAADKEKMEKEQAETEQKLSQQRVENVQGLRKEAAALTKDFRQTKAAAKRINNLAYDKDGNINFSPATALGLTFNIMKIFDPGSVVRESEFRTAADARAALSEFEQAGIKLPTQVVQAVQKLEGGGALTKEQIQDFVRISENLYQGARENILDDLSPILSSAKANNYELDRIFNKSLLDELNSPIEPVSKKQADGQRFVYNPETGRLEPKK